MKNLMTNKKSKGFFDILVMIFLVSGLISYAVVNKELDNRYKLAMDQQKFMKQSMRAAQ